jgi:hypothetical protein
MQHTTHLRGHLSYSYTHLHISTPMCLTCLYTSTPMYLCLHICTPIHIPIPVYIPLYPISIHIYILLCPYSYTSLYTSITHTCIHPSMQHTYTCIDFYALYALHMLHILCPYTKPIYTPLFIPIYTPILIREILFFFSFFCEIFYFVIMFHYSLSIYNKNILFFLNQSLLSCPYY